METTIIYSDFKTLREAYIEVKKFIKDETYAKTLSLKTRIEYDLGCAGDDNLELLEKFTDKYNLNFEGFDYGKHFLSEGELMEFGSIPLAILSMLIYLVAIVVKAITYGKIDFTEFRLSSVSTRQTLDMTFGDMVTWYLAGKYTLRSDTNFKLTPPI